MIPYKQLSLADIFQDCQNNFDNDKYAFLELLEQTIDLDDIVAILPEGRLMIMIKRETYMSRISLFIGNDLVKVLTGIRRSGKSAMLDLIKEELCASGIDSRQFISINFENSEMASF